MNLAEAPDWLVVVKVKSVGCHSSREMAIHPCDFSKQGVGNGRKSAAGKGVSDVTEWKTEWNAFNDWLENYDDVYEIC
ncbi:hypothetical protein TNIN_67691 [Trichonephila inaurata madagascariensis]|uniref:Uncharacterized protein n=1 Tax=Trichonephila inaurata madagascariensis TaxID=2747483 RepID=A0A8X6JYH6_9ARAC|nr:hypothetical protein TNIN_67691 [Trichonephila inaurata madagascariensis]